MKILMVCLGNICRSPLAEGIMRAKTEKMGLDWQIDSAGTGAWHIGNLPDQRSRAVAKAHGIDITDQRARQLVVKDFERFDLILAMDQSNYQNIIQLAQNDQQKEKVNKILDLANNQNKDVPDPYYDDDGFGHVYQLLDKACNQLINKLSSDIL